MNDKSKHLCDRYDLRPAHGANQQDYNPLLRGNPEEIAALVLSLLPKADERATLPAQALTPGPFDAPAHPK